MGLNSATMASGTVGNMLTTIANSLNQHRIGLLAALDLNLGDVVTTHIGLVGGIPEGNPLPARLLASGGESAIFGAKFGIFAAMILLICLLGGRYPKLWHVVTVVNLLLAAVVISNATQIFAL